MKKCSILVVGCLLLAVFFSCLFVNTASAQADDYNLTTADDYRERERQRIENGGINIEEADEDVNWVLLIGGDGAVPFGGGHCTNCNWFNTTVCARDGVLGSEWYHSTPLTSDCRITSLMSRGALMCPTCLTVWEVFDYHYCWEVHNKCSIGAYDICPMKVS